MNVGMTHSKAASLIVKYFEQEHRCTLPLIEPKLPTRPKWIVGEDRRERPDVIAFTAWGKSCVGEFKASEQDFRADVELKPFRLDPRQGMGNTRIFFCEPGVLEAYHLEGQEVLAGWGLVYLIGRSWRTEIKPRTFKFCNLIGEREILVNASKSLSHAAGRTPTEARPSQRGKPTEKFIQALKQYRKDLGGAECTSKVLMIRHGSELRRLAGGNLELARKWSKQLLEAGCQ